VDEKHQKPPGKDYMNDTFTELEEGRGELPEDILT
jgi:hypothetical protein